MRFQALCYDEVSQQLVENKVEDSTDANGIRTTVEYSTNEEGKKVKVRYSSQDSSTRIVSSFYCFISSRTQITRRTKRTLQKSVVDHAVAERQKWAKFGHEKGSKPGPDRATTTVGENVFLALGAGNKVRLLHLFCPSWTWTYEGVCVTVERTS